MGEANIQFPEAVSISVERMMQFCYVFRIVFECAHYERNILPVHLTRFGTMFFQSASFLYSLFDDRKDSTNLLKIWKGFDHPFENDLRSFDFKLTPFKEDLKKVRNRVGFHGSLTRSHEKAGLGMFDLECPRGAEFATLLRDMNVLAPKMIKWFDERQPTKLFQEFWKELRDYKVVRS